MTKLTLIMVATTAKQAKKILAALPDDADVFSGEVDPVALDVPAQAQIMGARCGSAIYRERRRKANEARQRARWRKPAPAPAPEVAAVPVVEPGPGPVAEAALEWGDDG